MSKRTDAIRGLFTAAPQTSPLSADNTAPAPLARVSSGAVRSLKESFSEVEKENQELRDKLTSGATIVEIDPGLIDPSPVSDRFRDDDTASYELLKQSISQIGQEVPVLVRKHPTMPGRYQSAYGHRRVRAARELGIAVKAILKPLSDEALVVAQGLENAPREDLSFIERAMFAMRIEDAGHKRAVVQDALAVDRAEASKLIAVARSIPPDIIDAIGKAPKVGRGRWQSFADLLADASVIDRVRAAIGDDKFAGRESDDRFLTVFSAANKPAATRQFARSSAVLASDGQRIAQVRQGDRELKLTIDKKVPALFADFLITQLPNLFETFCKSDRSEETTGA
ncbi:MULTISPECIES: plasmid partitioning protein RepB [Bradyrhizobium]|uniref:Plasmid partitioning protein RepB n=3 Tax=Bradyrhizobium TaxID=374 RepID=A0A410VHQ3_9BRAD|nr:MULTISPECIES: plasmid partitioning protein RepB [Bradyrhizobium]MCG2633126.1 plasmid partitioning protein RepB [Bradyrhizobium zhengyangense]MCG2645694.1 plasmid partitioning protein RepB [Bradyrhizobium zhengyangense]MCG2673315.1 plasmid partitioning protein RepB [Bradyrhizobium zhengyangense]MDN4985459.1 plasmid partitioning protein RepB [Bradyrhizobium sp. WYCCWR 13022]MDN5006224.1 plasmid partitioning protein RepB [Bradyrhizobium sp. WYCCWR 12677]